MPLPSGAAQQACAAPPGIAQVLALDQRDRTREAYAGEKPLREFVLFSYRNIANDIVNGQGVYLDALVAGMSAGCAGDETTKDWLRQLLAASDSSTDFARRIGVAGHLLREARER